MVASVLAEAAELASVTAASGSEEILEGSERV